MKRNVVTIIIIAILVATQLPFVAGAVDTQTVDITNPGFMFVTCDGPDLSKLPSGQTMTVTIKGVQQTVTTGQIPSTYTPCNFNAAVNTVQHLINIAVVVGVCVALGGFCYIGYLYMTGTQENIKKAKSILPKIFFGFIIMLSAWFIVYQLLSWLGASEGFKSLLGSP